MNTEVALYSHLHEGPTARHKPAQAARPGKTTGPGNQRAEGPARTVTERLCRAFSPQTLSTPCRFPGLTALGWPVSGFQPSALGSPV
jgi:hypothetical protein